MKTKLPLILLLSAFQLFSFSACAALELTPGFTFSDVSGNQNRIVNSNRLYTLVGSAVPLPGFITNRTDSVVNNTNFYVLVASNGVLYKLRTLFLLSTTNSINPTNLQASVAGSGLTVDTDYSLKVNVDGLTVKITNDVITLDLTTEADRVAAIATNVATYLVGSSTSVTTISNYISTNAFTSFDYPLSSGLSVNTNHNLGAAPKEVRAVLVCQTADAGYAVLDEVDAHGVNGVLGQDGQMVAWGGNATNVFAVVNSSSYGANNLNHKTTGADASITEARWKLRLYARP